MKIEMDYIEQLIKLVCDNGLSELSLEEGEKAIIIRREKEIVTAHNIPGIKAEAPTLTPVTAATPESMESVSGKKTVPITSPMVGSFYRAPSPGSSPFTEIGKSISTGQVVCIIEAMKLMNEIEAEVSGKVVEICVQDGQPVEYGQVLMLIEP